MDRILTERSRSGHGGDIYSDRSRQWLDLSANINPHPLPSALYEALPGLLESARAYPDIEYTDLRRDLAAYAGRLGGVELSPDWIIPGNGAVEILDKALAAAGGVLIVRPCFSEYELSCLRHGIPYKVLDRPVTGEACLGEPLFAKIRTLIESDPPGPGRIDTVILCNPNNPDGKRYDKAAVERFLTDAPQAGLRLIVDETFGEYLEDDAMLLPLVKNHENLLVVKALTKFFGLPGVRLGYAITGDGAWRGAIRRGLVTWNVGAFAQGIARILLNESDFIAGSRADNRTVRADLAAGLEQNRLIEAVYPSQANFLMIRSQVLPFLLQGLRQRGILIRDLGGMPALGPGFARIAVKDRSSADRLLAALGELEGALY